MESSLPAVQLSQPSSSPQPNWLASVKNQTLLIIDTSMSILMGTFCCCWTLSWLSEYDYIETAATDTQVGLNCDKRIYFVVCWVLMGNVRDLEAWHEADNICQVKFKGWQGQNFYLKYEN